LSVAEKSSGMPFPDISGWKKPRW